MIEIYERARDREGEREKGRGEMWRNPFLWQGPRGSCAPVNLPFRALQSYYSVATETDRQTNKTGLDLSHCPKSSPISLQSAHWIGWGLCSVQSFWPLLLRHGGSETGRGQRETEGEWSKDRKKQVEGGAEGWRNAYFKGRSSAWGKIMRGIWDRLALVHICLFPQTQPTSKNLLSFVVAGVCELYLI